MRMHGSNTHCEVEERAGKKNATSGKAGFSRLLSGSRVMVPLLLLLAGSSRRFLRGRCEDEGGIAGMFVCYRNMVGITSWTPSVALRKMCPIYCLVVTSLKGRSRPDVQIPTICLLPSIISSSNVQLGPREVHRE